MSEILNLLTIWYLSDSLNVVTVWYMSVHPLRTPKRAIKANLLSDN